MKNEEILSASYKTKNIEARIITYRLSKDLIELYASCQVYFFIQLINPATYSVR